MGANDSASSISISPRPTHSILCACFFSRYTEERRERGGSNRPAGTTPDDDSNDKMNGHVLPPLQILDVRDTAAMGLATAANAAVQQIQTRNDAASAEYHAEDSSGELVAISVAFAVLTTLLLCLRFYAKRFQTGGIFADEIFLVLAWFVNLGMCALGIGES